MGCDIHIVIEQKDHDNDKWVGVWSGEKVQPGERPEIKKRFYVFFTELAGVRGTSPTSMEPRGLPDDASELVHFIYRDGIDCHTASWATPEEFCAAWSRAKAAYKAYWLGFADDNPIGRKYALEAAKNYDTFSDENLLYDLLGLWGDEGDQFRVVFWFDN